MFSNYSFNYERSWCLVGGQLSSRAKAVYAKTFFFFFFFFFFFKNIAIFNTLMLFTLFYIYLINVKIFIPRNMSRQ